MSVSDEDNELRDLLVQTLETNGTLGKIKAQLRASVFLALEEKESVQNKSPFLNTELRTFLQTKEGKLVGGLVREFLQHFELESTLAVFDVESGVDSESGNWDDLVKELNMGNNNLLPKAPLLLDLVNQQNSNNLNYLEQNFLQPVYELTRENFAEARQRFNQFDSDKKGSIDKDELKDLFIGMFPNFNRNMLDRYVSDAVRDIEKDFSHHVNVDEFLDIYKRFFNLCKDVVTRCVSLCEPDGNSLKPWSGNPSVNGKLKPAHHLEDQSMYNQIGDLNTWRQDIDEGAAPKINRKKTSVDNLFGELEDDPFFDDPFPPVSSELKPFGRHETSAGDPNRRSHIPVCSALRKKSSDSRKTKPLESQIGSGHVQQQTKMADAVLVKPVSIQAGGTSLDSGSSSSSSEKFRESSSRNRSNIDRLLRGSDQKVELKFDDDDDDDDYEDDFHSDGHSNKTPRTASRSEQRSQNGSIAEEIEEELDDLSLGTDDFQKSSHSGFADLTTDRTISQHEIGFDYMEDVLST